MGLVKRVCALLALACVAMPASAADCFSQYEVYHLSRVYLLLEYVSGARICTNENNAKAKQLDIDRRLGGPGIFEDSAVSMNFIKSLPDERLRIIGRLITEDLRPAALQIWQEWRQNVAEPDRFQDVCEVYDQSLAAIEHLEPASIALEEAYAVRTLLLQDRFGINMCR